MSIVLDPNKQLVNIVTYYIEKEKKAGNSVFYFINSAESMDEWKNKGYITKSGLAEKRKSGEDFATQAGIIEELRTTWRRLTWKDQNDISAKSLMHIPTQDNQTRIQWDGIKFRDMKLKVCLKGWDLTDENGNKVPITNEVIDNLVPEVANQLLNDFERVTEPSEDDLGN